MHRLFLCLLISYLSFASAERMQMTLFVFNDIHTLQPTEEKYGGVAEMLSLLEECRNQEENHLTIFNGNLLSPLFPAVDRGAHVIDLLNAMKVDLVTIGITECDYSLVELKNRIAESRFSWLAINALSREGEPLTGNDQIKIIDQNGIKIALFGLIDFDHFTSSQVFLLPPFAQAQNRVKELKESGVDVVILVTNLPLSLERRIAREVDGIDVILGRHSRDPLAWYEKKVLIHKSSTDCHFLSKIDLFIDKKSSPQGTSIEVYPCFRMLVNKGYRPHPELTAKIDYYRKIALGN